MPTHTSLLLTKSCMLGFSDNNAAFFFPPGETKRGLSQHPSGYVVNKEMYGKLASSESNVFFRDKSDVFLPCD